jgi:hypothetical protein
MSPPPEDRFAGALRSEAELRELYELPSGLAARKQIDHLDEGCRRLVALARSSSSRATTPTAARM